MQNYSEFAEMVNSTNYAAMSYGELVTLNFAFLLALGEIKPLMGVKRAEEMQAITNEYVAKMNPYGASKAEILACLEKEALRDDPFGPLASKNVDDQTPTTNVENNQDKGEDTLALPEPKSTMGDLDMNADLESLDSDTTGKDEADPATNEQEAGDTIPMTPGEHNFVAEALEALKALPTPDTIDANAPYYVEGTFKYGDSAKPGYSYRRWRNMDMKDLEAFRSATEKYEKLFLKHDVLVSTDDYLVINQSKTSLKVRMYHFPEEGRDEAEPITFKDDSRHSLSEDELKRRKMWTSLMRKAIKQAKELSLSDGTDPNTPFYDRYKFGRDGKILNLYGDRERFYEDADTLSELMPSFETYARLYCEESLVVSKDNCVANVSCGTIYLVLFNIPSRKKRRNETKASKPVVMEKNAPTKSEEHAIISPTRGEKDLILNAVEMTREQPVGSSTDINKPYSVQQNYIITNSGELFRDGKTFSTNLSVEMIDKNKTLHRKYARTMKASALVSTDDYTAYIWDEGKKLSVFYYNSKNKATSAA